jgi:hypothetical protein
MGKLSFAASMNWNFIDFPLWRKNRGPFEDFRLLALLGRFVDLALAAAINPVAQGRQANLEVRGNRPSAAVVAIALAALPHPETLS